MVHSNNHTEIIDKLYQVLIILKIYNPLINFKFLDTLLLADKFQSNHTLTNFLNSFIFSLITIIIISPDTYIMIQDHPS